MRVPGVPQALQRPPRATGVATPLVSAASLGRTRSSLASRRSIADEALVITPLRPAGRRAARSNVSSTSGLIGLPTRQLFDPIRVGAELAGGRGATLRPAP